jgi:mono/diheme cytochrome c family protein
MRVSSGSRSGDSVRSGLLAVVLAVLLLFYVDARPAFAQAGPDAVTFTRDVAPILFENCVSCHRPGEIGPMALTSYEEIRPWARVIRERVETRAMPPWHASPEHGEFANDRRLSDEAIRTVLAWVDAGAPRGDAADLPSMPT